MITLHDVEQAAGRIAGRVIRTPMVPNPAISRLTGADVVLKLDNLQVTGAFKERGAANRLSLLSSEERERGVIAMSAGNHAQAVARHASLLGIAATIVMPKFTPSTKVTRTASWGANVVLVGETLAEAAAHARELAAIESLVFIHPYDDLGIIAGQGTMALEMLQDTPDLDALIIPVGGGGLLAGCLVAATALHPGIAVYGAEVETYAAMAQRVAGRTVSVGGATIAEGIAVRDIGEIPFEIVRRRVAGILVTPERAIEEAIGLLVEDAKTVAEGAGAAGLAALLAHPERFRGKKVGVAITGGNIDARILSNVLLARPAARRQDSAAAPADSRSPRRPRRHRRQNRQLRRQHYRSLPPAAVRLLVGPGRRTGSHGRGPRQAPCRRDRRGAGADIHRPAGVTSGERQRHPPASKPWPGYCACPAGWNRRNLKPMTDPRPSHLATLEAESIQIFREVAAQAARPVLLYSIGKDSSVLLHLARKAFYPARPPFPLLHIDTTWKFRAMIAFRDATVRRFGFRTADPYQSRGNCATTSTRSTTAAPTHKS